MMFRPQLQGLVTRALQYLELQFASLLPMKKQQKILVLVQLPITNYKL